MTWVCVMGEACHWLLEACIPGEFNASVRPYARKCGTDLEILEADSQAMHCDDTVTKFVVMRHSKLLIYFFLLRSQYTNSCSALKIADDFLNRIQKKWQNFCASGYWYLVFVQLDEKKTCELNNINIYSLYYVDQWRRVFIEKMTVTQLVRKFPTFVEPEHSCRANNSPLLDCIEGTF